MKLKLTVIVAAVFVCCSPNSQSKDSLIGNWNSSVTIYKTTINSTTNQVIISDTIDITRQLQISSTGFNVNSSIQYKVETTLSTDTLITFNYSKSNDSLFVLSKGNKTENYKYNIKNDSLFLDFLYGDTIPIDNFTSILTGKYKKQ